MTKEEAIKSVLKYLVHKQQEQGSWGYADNDNINKVPWDEAIEWIDQRSCGDLISRQAVIDTIETDCSWDIFNEWGSRTPTGENIINAIKSVPSVEPKKCGDCISRQAVIDRINKLIEVEKKQGTDDWGYGRERVNAYEAMLHFVKSEYLHPSVEPERKTGKWIRAIEPDVNAWTGGHTCSECGRACVQMSMNYCANCGAPMEVET